MTIDLRLEPPREWFAERIAYYVGLGAEESEASRLAGEDWAAILEAMDPNPSALSRAGLPARLQAGGPTAQEMGRKGGTARFAGMTAAERSDLGKKGAAARWGKP